MSTSYILSPQAPPWRVAGRLYLYHITKLHHHTFIFVVSADVFLYQEQTVDAAAVSNTAT
jgi:hypothetical protein